MAGADDVSCAASSVGCYDIGRIQAEHKVVLSSLRELKADIKDINTKLAQLVALEAKDDGLSKSIDQAEGRLHKLEEKATMFQTFTDRLDGMLRLAYAAWVLIASGVGFTLFKVLTLAGGS